MRRALHTDCGGGKVEKNIGILLLCVVLLFSSTSCFGADFYQGERPTDYEKTIWKSTQPDIWFEIGERDEMGILPDVKGEATTSEGTIVITVWFDHARLIEFDFPEKNENGTPQIALLGDCKFSSDKLIVTPREGKDQLFNGEYDTITFTRIDLESTST